MSNSLKKLKFTVPYNDIFSFFYDNSEFLNSEGLIDLIRTDEQDCLTRLIENKTDIALLSPFTYALGSLSDDIRILGDFVYALEDYTGTTSICFKSGIHDVFTAGVEDPSDFTSIISRLLFAERYNIFLELVKQNKPANLSEMTNDLYISKEPVQGIDSVLDLGEDWFDMYECPLPLAFWVCRAELEHSGIYDLLRDLALPNINDLTIVEKAINTKSKNLRTGKIIRKWNESVTDGLNQAIYLLYFHQLIKEIVEIKIYGADNPL